MSPSWEEMIYKNIENELKDNITQGVSSAAISNQSLCKLDYFSNLDNWDVLQAPNDSISFEGNTSGASYIKISKSPFDENTETVLLSKFILTGQMKAALGMSLSQRIAQQRFSFEFVECDIQGNLLNEVSAPAELNISSISQATTTLTVNTAVPHNLLPNDRILIYNVPDSRMNYSEALVANVNSPTQFTVTNTVYAAIPSATISSQASGKIQKLDPFSLNNNAFGVFWEGTSTSNAKIISRNEKKSFLASPDSAFGSNNTNATAGSSSPYCDSLNPSYLYDIKFKNEGFIVRTIPANSISGLGGTIKRTGSIPETSKFFKIRIKAYSAKALSRPIAKIAQASKSGSSTVTITTDVPHNLTTSSYVQIYGVRDQTNFANLSTPTPVASIINATQFTIPIGSSATATSYGGAVILVNGALNTSPLVQVIQSLARSNNLLTLTANTTLSGIAIGETVSLYGISDTAGNPLPQYEGIYKVANVNSSTLTLYSEGADFGLINCGGMIIKRTDFRLHSLRIVNYTKHIVDIEDGNGNISDQSFALPVGIVNTPNVNVTGTPTVVGSAAHDAAISGNPVRNSGRAVTANYTAVSSGDVADLITTLVGALIIRQNSIPENAINNFGTLTNNSDNTLFAAAGTGIRNYLTSIQLQNTNATATTVAVKDNTTVKWQVSLPANMALPLVVNFTDPILMTANTVTNIACGTTGANVLVNAQGYKAP